MLQLLTLVIAFVVSVTVVNGYYPCYSADCIPGKYCRVAEVQCIRAPCPPQVKCVDSLSASTVCTEGLPVLEMFGNTEIRCSSTRSCPDSTTCVKGYCCWGESKPVTSFPPIPTPSPVKEGSCPDASGQIGICLEGCSNDQSCPGSQKCCGNGCGRVCTNPVLRNTKPGTCPAASTLTTQCSINTRQCFDDYQCPSFQKCCLSPCGRSCHNTMETSVRQGTCPTVTGFGACVEECSYDGNCRQGHKCCSNGCGRSCMVTAESRTPRPGQCPNLPPSTNCFRTCTYDSSCPGSMKCCSNGCGATCTSVQQVNPTCAQNYNIFFLCYLQSRCVQNSDCGFGGTCCMSTLCGGRICSLNVDQPLNPIDPFVPYQPTTPQRCTWWKYIYAECRW